ncbi:thioredoxin-like protein 1 [Culicoides brevitarsis]|uniref:thioredoxin-like protein 1 n=1 Tax=Culicoides brevitarsis TaxID=469753 RepID=UPI00307BFF0A
MAVRAINDDSHFQAELTNAGIKLVVVDFTATWCGPCRSIAPHFERLPAKYPKAIFLKVDVDKCQDTAAGQGVSAMPTFIFYRNRTKIDRIQGADINALESKITQHYASGEDGDNGDDYGQGLMDLATFIQANQCECLNEADDHPLAHCLKAGAGYLASDCDEQLIVSITFNQAVKIHSIKVKAPPAHAPKDIKLFINQPRTLDFDMAEGYVSVQDLSLTAKDCENGTPVNLRFVKFQNVQNIQIFIKNNQTGDDKTVIEHLAFIGAPIITTKMDDFKRVAGKKGEAH